VAFAKKKEPTPMFLKFSLLKFFSTGKKGRKIGNTIFPLQWRGKLKTSPDVGQEVIDFGG
jgi:hypothetical protein